MKPRSWSTTAILICLWVLASQGCKDKKTGRTEEETTPQKTEEEIMTERFQAFLDGYLPEAKRLEKAEGLALWEAYTTGKDEAYAAAEKAEIERKKYHSDKAMYEEIKAIHDSGAIQDPLLARQVVLIHNDFAENQISEELMEKMVALSTEVQKEFNTHRAKVGEEEYDRNAVKEVLRTGTDDELRRQVWESHKSIGGRIAPDVLELVKLRNEAAKELGYASYWEMSMVLQEHDPDRVTEIFADLDRQTAEPYAAAKAEMDAALAERLGVAVEDLRPWHYADPFVQEAPVVSDFDLDTLYEGQDLLEIARRYYKSFGLDPEPILDDSDVLPREGKSPHAFCFTVDRDEPDVRVFLNLKPTDAWMDTTLHELGHGFYDSYYDDTLPWVLRQPSHILTTEGVAMLFGEMSKNPNWLAENLEIDEETMPAVVAAAEEARVLQKLVFARWSLVMFHFEKALYSDPSQDLDALWWDLVEKYQMVHRPDERTEPDWSTKDHIVVAPVYYHNYVLGDMFKSQLLEAVARHTGKSDPMEVTFQGDQKAGSFLVEKVLKPGASMHFLELTEAVTGEEFSAAAYGRSLVSKDPAPAGEEEAPAEEEEAPAEEEEAPAEEEASAGEEAATEEEAPAGEASD